MNKKITISPITRLEGHGKIEVFLDDNGNVDDAYWQVVELRGFERFCLGRPAEEMPRITTNICGVCPTPHNVAATKALDDLYSVSPTPAASLIRQLHYNAFIVEDHFLHFFFLAAPDFIVGPQSDPAERNILGLIARVGLDIGKQVIDIRKKCRDIIRLVGGKAPHPEGGLPGGVSKGIEEGERAIVRKIANEAIDFALFALELFKKNVLADKKYLDLILSQEYQLKTYYMGLVDEQNKLSFYDGKVRIVNPKGQQFALFDPAEYIEHIGEWVEPWTYIKLNHLRKLGWKGLHEDDQTSLYRVGPLARLNAADGMATPLAQKEYDDMFTTLGGKPSHHTMAFHWARLIEALQAAEELKIIADNSLLCSKDIRNMNLKLKKTGIGCVEAARGTLIHHYETDDRGLLTSVNLIVATQHNAAPICLSIKKAAREFIKGPEVKEGLLNMVEMAFRAYDPCLGCATHSLSGENPIEIVIRDSKGKVITSTGAR
jgi:F420-non-reducing hydrogenase large subunit